ncbi:MAG: hypothetical protein IKG25_04165 [Mogibacterium sp.]|nr:hypothetical protein [Mogibacterium sp.]
MPNVKVVLRQGEVRAQLLKGGGAPGMCLGIANQMANKAGPGYAARMVNYPERTGAIVYPKTAAARANNYASNTLEKVRGGKYNG